MSHSRNHLYLSLALAAQSLRKRDPINLFFFSLHLRQSFHKTVLWHMSKSYLPYCDGQKKFLRGSDRSICKAAYSVVFHVYAYAIMYDILKTRTKVDTITIWLYPINNNNIFCIFQPKRVKENSREHIIQYIWIICYTDHKIRMTWIPISGFFSLLNSPIHSFRFCDYEKIVFKWNGFARGELSQKISRSIANG